MKNANDNYIYLKKGMHKLTQNNRFAFINFKINKIMVIFYIFM